MNILITNDDGVVAPGLLALIQALRSLGKVSVLAPDRNWSASGHVKTLHRPLRVRETHLADGSAALSCDGAPSDCVALALLGLFDFSFDLVVSGINPNANLGHDVTYSGTVTAAMEAVIAGVPGVAVSLDTPDDLVGAVDYSGAAIVAQKICHQVAQHQLPPGVLLNVNVPYGALNQFAGVQVTRQGMRIYRDKLIRREDPRKKPYYWIGGDAPTGVPDDGTDIGALARGFVSITPLKLDLTAHECINDLKSIEWI